MPADPSTIHASAVLVGPKAVLIRGPSGSGKSRLAWQILQSDLPFTRLVGDDRVHVEALGGRLLVRPSEALAGLIEIRGLGVRRLSYEPVALVGLVVDLAATDAERMPPAAIAQTGLAGVTLPRLAVAAGVDGLQMLIGFLGTAPGGD
jgi:serine kinase of HPr protein (carbohydrate metabolism regulator)